jgi:hypothetical protein
MRNVSDKSRKENQNISFMFNHSFLPENHAGYANVQKCGRARQTTRDNTMLHIKYAICM